MGSKVGMEHDYSHVGSMGCVVGVCSFESGQPSADEGAGAGAVRACRGSGAGVPRERDLMAGLGWDGTRPLVL